MQPRQQDTPQEDKNLPLILTLFVGFCYLNHLWDTEFEPLTSFPNMTCTCAVMISTYIGAKIYLWDMHGEGNTLRDHEQKQSIVPRQTFQNRLDDIKFDESKIPSYYIDSITQEIMNEPVALVPTGHSVEQTSAIAILSGNRRCPLSRKPFTGFTPNISLKCAINNFVSSKEQEHKDNLAKLEEKQLEEDEEKNRSESDSVIRPLKIDSLTHLRYSILSSSKRRIIDHQGETCYEVMRKPGG